MTRISILIAAAIVMTGCAEQAGDDISEQFGSEIKHIDWQLSELNGRAVTVSQPSLTISDDEFTGNGGCNSMFGDVTVGQSSIAFHSVISTQIACIDESTPVTSPSVMEVENAYTSALSLAKHWSLVDQQLTIQDGADQTILIFSEPDN